MKKPAKKAAKKVTKKVTKKLTKKVTKKPAKKTAKKVTKKLTKKVAPKPAKKVTKKVTEKPAKKTAKTTAKTTAKKATPKVIKKVTPKPTKKGAKSVTSGAAAKKAVKAIPRVGSVKPRFRKPVAPKDTIRRPQDSEELKQKLGALSQATNQIRGLKRSLNKNFYEVGQILRDIEGRRLYEVKGYGSFEAFVDREIDIGKQLSLKIARIVQVFLRDAALSAGLERLSAALDALDGDTAAEAPAQTGSTSVGSRSPIPFHKQ